VNSLSVDRALHLDQLVGNYSRVGFHHPGPAYFYILAAGQFVFHDAMHMVSGPYNGQLLALVVLAAIVLAFATRIVYRLTGSVLAAATAFALLFWYSAANHMIGDNWFPFLYMPAFLLMLLAAAALAAGRTAELPPFVIAAMLLLHGHISFVMFVGVTTVVVSISWYRVRRGMVRDEYLQHRRLVLTALALLALLLLPVVLNVVLHYPGEWGNYYRFVTDSKNTPRSFGDVWSFFSWYWSHGAVSVLVATFALIGAVALLVTEHDPNRRRSFLAAYAVLALETLLFIVYVARGVDALIPTNRYVGNFYLTVPISLVVLAVAQLATRVQDAIAARGLSTMLTPIVAGVAVLGLVLPTIDLRPSWITSKAFPAIVDALRVAPGRGSRPVAVQIVDGRAWPAVAGIAIEAQRDHLPWCVVGTAKIWNTMFTSRNICAATTGRLVVKVAVQGRGQPQPGSTVIWQGPTPFVSGLLLTTSAR
jgi:hypothetical protein